VCVREGEKEGEREREKHITYFSWKTTKKNTIQEVRCTQGIILIWILKKQYVRRDKI
jgi:hypothetical protein